MSTPFTEETFADRLRGRTVKELHDLRQRLQNERGPKSALLGGEKSRSGRSDAEIEEINRDVVALNDQIAAVNAKIEEHARVKEAFEKNPNAVEVAFGRQQPAGGDGSSGHGFDAARRVIDAAFRSQMLPDHAAEKALNLLEAGPVGARSLAARWVTATGNPEYLSAFSKLCADPTTGHRGFTPPELEAYQAVHDVHSELRAMSTGAGAGGELIPLTLDPAILLTNAGSINPLRDISRVVQTVSNTWQGVNSAGVTSEWKTENAQAADASPTLAPVSIPVFLGDADVPFSYEVEQDAIEFVFELQKILLDSAVQLQNTAYTTGNGTTAPGGFITGATTGPVSTAGAFAASHVFAVQNALPARFSAGAAWAGHLAVINTIAQFETTAGALKFPQVGDGKLLNRPLYELSNMSSDMTTATSKFLAYGDFRAGFVIVDRIGTTLEILPGYGANQRPTASKHAFMTFRTGSKVVVPDAFRLLIKS